MERDQYTIPTRAKGGAKVDEDALLEAVRNLEDSEDFNKQENEVRQKLMDLYRSEYIPGANESLSPQPYGNFYLSLIETEMPVIDDHMGHINIIAREENDAPAADMMQLRVDSLLDQGRFRAAAHQCSKDAKIMRNGITQAKLDVEDGVFQGIRFEPVDLKTFYASPGYTGLDIREDEAAWVGFKTPMTVAAIKRHYGIEVKAEGCLDKYGTFVEIENSDQYPDSALICEYYYMPEDSNKYPDGRVIMWCQDHVIVDRPMEGRIPYFMITNYTTAGSGKGISDVELIKPFVETENSIMANLAELVIDTNKPLILGKKKWFSKAIDLVSKRKNREVVEADPGDLSFPAPNKMDSASLSVLEAATGRRAEVSGVHDYFAGKTKFDQSGEAIGRLQEAAMRRVRLHLSQDVNPYLQAIGEFVLDAINKYDTEVQMLRREIDPTNYEWLEYDPQKLRDTKFNVMVEIGNAGRAEQVAEAMSLFDKGVYGIEELVEVLPVRNKAEKIKRFYERQGLAAEKQRKEELEEMDKQLSVYAKEILVIMDSQDRSQNDMLRIKVLEDRVMKLVQQFPEIPGMSKAWMAIPVDMQARIASAAFVRQPEGM